MRVVHLGVASFLLQLAPPPVKQKMASNDEIELGNQGQSSIQLPAGNKPSRPLGYELKKHRLLLATLVATVTYVAGTNLPGGVWQDTQDGHLAGDLILPTTHYHRYLAFYYCNATAFAGSIVVCLLLLILEADDGGVLEATVWVVMVIDLVCLTGAYVAGSSRDAFTTIYSSVLMCAFLAYMSVFFLVNVVSRLTKKQLQQPGGDDLQEQGDQDGNNIEPRRDEEPHEALMVLATFVVTITYVSGLNPPGGFWSNTQDGHRVSAPILMDSNPARYQAFFFFNTAAFVASLLIITLFLDRKLSRRIISANSWFVALYVYIATVLLGLVGAYVAGSSWVLNSAIYPFCLIGLLFSYIFLRVAIGRVTRSIEIKNYCCPGLLETIGGAASRCFARSSGGRDTIQEPESARNLVILLATLVTSITYQAGLDPPGGVWPQDLDGHKCGDPILLTTHPTRYKVFFYSNSAAFIASLIVMTMLYTRILYIGRRLEMAMLLDLFGLIGAYAAGSCRDLSSSLYVVALAGIVFVYVEIHIVFFAQKDHSCSDKQSEAMLENKRQILLLLAILSATLTYQSGLTPPGGFWSADDQLGHRAGFPVLPDNYPRRYKAFFYCNAMSFMSSVALIVLLVNPNLYRLGIRCYALYVSMIVGIIGLIGAYAAGSSRHLQASVYVLVLAALVSFLVILQAVILCTRSRRRNMNMPETVPCPGSGERGAYDDSDIAQIRHTDLSDYCMTLGVMAASVTYQAGLKPPGGLWQDNVNGHSAGSSVLLDVDKRRFLAFAYSNSTSFMASISVIISLLPGMLHLQYRTLLWPIKMAIPVGMLGLLGAYAAGTTREWDTPANVIALLVPVLVFIAAVSFCCRKKGQRGWAW